MSICPSELGLQPPGAWMPAWSLSFPLQAVQCQLPPCPLSPGVGGEMGREGRSGMGPGCGQGTGPLSQQILDQERLSALGPFV